MKKTYESTFRQLHVTDSYQVTETGRRVMTEIADIENKLKAMKRDGQSNKKINSFLENALYEMQLKHWQANRNIVETAQAELDKLGEMYQRKQDPTRELLQRQRYESRYRIMTDEELLVAAEEYINSEPTETPPDALEVLAVELAGRPDTKDTAAVLRDRMKANHYDQPWRYTEAGDKLVEKIQSHDTEFGELHVSQDGGESLITYEIETLLNENAEDIEND